MADAEQAIALDPANADAFDTRGRIYMKLGLQEKAAADLKHAIALNPGLRETADALRRLGTR